MLRSDLSTLISPEGEMEAGASREEKKDVWQIDIQLA